MPIDSDHASAAPVWAIVLAGGEGVRLRPLVRELCGEERPKQFAKIVGSKSLLGHTIERVGLEIPPACTVIVTCRAHSEYMAEEFAGTPPHAVLVQPRDWGGRRHFLSGALDIFDRPRRHRGLRERSLSAVERRTL